MVGTSPPGLVRTSVLPLIELLIQARMAAASGGVGSRAVSRRVEAPLSA